MATSEAKTESLKQKAYAAIVEMIMNGELPCGSAVVERQLAEELEMSRAPIREALIALQQDGLVSKVGSRMRIIAEPTLQDIVEIYEARETLEGMATRLLALRITDKLLEELRKLAVKLDGPEGSKDPDEVHFHNLIITHCGNARLMQLTGPLHRRLVMRHLESLVVQRGQISFDKFRAAVSHQLIVEALQNSDPDQAEATARAHVRGLKAHLLQCIFETSPP